MQPRHLPELPAAIAALSITAAGAIAHPAQPPAQQGDQAPAPGAQPAALPQELAREQDRYDVYLVQYRGPHRATVQMRHGRVVAAEFDGRRLSPEDVRAEGRLIVVYETGAPVAAFRVPLGLLETPGLQESGGQRPPWMISPQTAQGAEASLGLSVSPAAEQDMLASTYREGLEVRQVRPRTAADFSGLRQGDIIVAVDGQLVRSVEDLRRLVGGRQDGAARVTFLRDGQEQWTTLRLGELPNRQFGIQEPEGLGRESDWNPDPARMLGMRFEPVRGGDLEGVPEYDRGLRVRGVTPGGPAEQAGLREGDILVALGNRRVASEDELSGALREAPIAEAVRLRIVRGGSVFNVPVEMTRTGEPAPAAREPADLERELGIEASWADEEALGGPGLWESGVLVESVAGGSVGERMGLQRGDVIVALNDAPMPTPERLSRRLAALDRSCPVRVTYLRNGQERIARFSMRR